MQAHIRRGFTLIELLIVIAIILILLSMGMFALGGLTSAPLEESANTIRASMSIARQYAVTHGVPVYVVFEDYGELRYSTTDPVMGGEADKWDKVSVVPMRLMKDLSPEAGKTLLQSPPTATFSYALDRANEPLMTRDLHKPVEYDYLPAEQTIRVLVAEGMPTVNQQLHVVRFNANGTCESDPAIPADPVIPSDRPGVSLGMATNNIRLSNFVALYDTIEDKRLYVYVYPSTCLPVVRGD